MADFVWHGPACLKAIEGELGRRLDASAITVANRAKKLLSVDGTGVAAGPQRNARGQFQKSKRLVYGAFPSKPGEPPHVQTGRLRSSVAWERSGMVARVGTNVPYGRYLEVNGPGGNGQKRPWLKRALSECIPAINIVMSRPFRG